MIAIDRAPSSLQVLVVDDEALARRNIIVLLQRDPNICVTESSSGRDAVARIRNSKPDIVFLDVQMPECDGFDVIELLGAGLPPAIIFVTAHDEYALRAFEAGALDYLLKPFDDARFDRALNRAKEKLAHHALAHSAAHKRAPARVVVKSRGHVTFLDLADIQWIEAAGYYACLHVGGETHILRRSLLELERELGKDEFIRIHRSIIVRLDQIQTLELREDGDYELVLKTLVRLRMSRRYRQRIQERLLALGK